MSLIPLTRCGPEHGGNFEYEWADGYIRAHFISDVGKKRQHNEDSVILCVPQEREGSELRGFFFGIADGMGGASAGEHASRLALETTIEELYSSPERSIPRRLREAIEIANLAIYREAEEHVELQGMGTTISALLVVQDCAYIAQVGDSRVYVSRGKTEFKQITEDHSLVAEQVRSGIISEEEARHHSLKNLITRAVGIKEIVQVDLYCMRLRKGDTLLLCSDGLSGLVDDDEIAESMQMQSLQGAARVLVGKALESGGNDNISVILVRIADTPPRSREIQDGCIEVSLGENGMMSRLRRLFT